MILEIKKCVLAWYIYDKNKNIVSKIKNKRFWGPAKNIISSNNITVYTTDIINRHDLINDCNCTDIKKYTLYNNGKTIAVASLTFVKPVKAAMSLRPPQVDEMLLETAYGLLRAKRQNDNGIFFYKDVQRIGVISPFFRLKPPKIEFDDNYDIAFISGLYVFVEYMMHEDDFIVV